MEEIRTAVLKKMTGCADAEAFVDKALELLELHIHKGHVFEDVQAVVNWLYSTAQRLINEPETVITVSVTQKMGRVQRGNKSFRDKAFIDEVMADLLPHLVQAFAAKFSYTALDAQVVESELGVAVSEALKKEFSDSKPMTGKGFRSYVFKSAYNNLKNASLGSESGTMISVSIARSDRNSEEALKMKKSIGTATYFSAMDDEAKDALLGAYNDEGLFGSLCTPENSAQLEDFLAEVGDYPMILQFMAGVRKNELKLDKSKRQELILDEVKALSTKYPDMDTSLVTAILSVWQSNNFDKAISSYMN